MAIKSLCFVVVFALFLCPSGMAQTPAEKSTATNGEAKEERYSSGWMKLKLEYSQKLMEAIAKADYDAIVQTAEGMQTLTTIEEFVRGKMPGYVVQLEIFKDANAELIRQGKRENIEGTALAFTQLTLSCVNCHKRLRESAKPSK